MNEYRDLALEAIATLGTVVDLIMLDKRGDLITGRVKALAMKLAVYDADAAWECMSADAEPEQADDDDPEGDDPDDDDPGDRYEELPVQFKSAPVPVIDVVRRKKVEGTEGMKVTKLPGTEVKPLPYEHAPNLKGSGRAGKPKQMFRMRRIGEAGWFNGTAGECAKHFGITPSQVYKWAGGKTKSGNFEVARV